MYKTTLIRLALLFWGDIAIVLLGSCSKETPVTVGECIAHSNSKVIRFYQANNCKIQKLPKRVFYDDDFRGTSPEDNLFGFDPLDDVDCQWEEDFVVSDPYPEECK